MQRKLVTNASRIERAKETYQDLIRIAKKEKEEKQSQIDEAGAVIQKIQSIDNTVNYKESINEVCEAYNTLSCISDNSLEVTDSLLKRSCGDINSARVKKLEEQYYYWTHEISRMNSTEIKREIITFGHYKQKNSIEKSPVNWLVLYKSDDSALVVSQKILDCKRFDDTTSTVLWRDSSLRKWLNQEFLRECFTSVEISKIQFTLLDGYVTFDHEYETTLLYDNLLPPSSKLTYPLSTCCDLPKEYAFIDTIDKVFLLSYFEARALLQNQKQISTPYSVSQGLTKVSGQLRTFRRETSWTRSTCFQDTVCVWDGSKNNSNYTQNSAVYPFANFYFHSKPPVQTGVRPAMWIKYPLN